MSLLDDAVAPAAVGPGPVVSAGAADPTAPAPSSSSRPVTDARTLLRRARLPLAGAALLGLAGLLFALFTSPTSREELDPDGATQAGSRAFARLLAARGVPVMRVPRLAADERRTVAVPSSGRVGRGDLARLVDVARRSDVVVVLDGDGDLEALGDVARHDELRTGFDAEHDPGCDLPAASTAGRARTGGTGVRVSGFEGFEVGARCYSSEGEPTLVALHAPGTTGSLTLLTSADLFRNDRLAQQGNAALALGLLDRGRPVAWLLPVAGEPVDDTGRATPLTRLLPARLLLAAGELLVLALLLALWRGRRLGPVVTEQLPVVVRSVETVYGRARLYRGARARDRAALALREAARARAARALGLGAETTPRVLVGVVAGQAGREPADVAGLLYGAAAPPDDTSLVRLADALDDLTRVLARGTPPTRPTRPATAPLRPPDTPRAPSPSPREAPQP